MPMTLQKQNVKRNKMIHKDKLKGKYVNYIDKQGKYRTHKVIKVKGYTLTVKDVLGVRHRIHPKTHLIFGRPMKNHIELIDWGGRQKMKMQVKPIVNRCTNCGNPYFTYDLEDNGLCGGCHWLGRGRYKHLGQKDGWYRYGD